MSFKDSTVSNGGTTAGFNPFPVVPVGTLEDDRLTAVVLTTDNAPDITPTAPAGFVLEASGSMPIDGTLSVSPVAVWIYGKDASAADEAGAGTDTYTWTFAGGEEQLAVLINTDPAEWGEFAKNEVSTTHTSIDAPSVTTTVPNELVIHCALKDNGTLFTVSNGGTLIEHEILGATNGAGGGLIMERFEQVTPGATGTVTFDHDSDESNGFTFSLRPLAVVTHEQAAFRGYEDGAHDTSIAIDAENTDFDRGRLSPLQLRIGTRNVGDADPEAPTLYTYEIGDGIGERRKVL